MDDETGDLVQVVQHEDDRRPVRGQRRGDLPGHLLQVVAGNGLAQAAAARVPDRGDERGPRRPSRRPAGRPRSVPSEIHAAAHDGSAAASQELASSVLPQPAGAAMSTHGGPRPAARRACSRGSDHHVGGERDGEPVVDQPRAVDARTGRSPSLMLCGGDVLTPTAPTMPRGRPPCGHPRRGETT